MIRQTRFLSAHDVARIVQTKGLKVILQTLVDAIEQDFKRWPEFDKSARTACHSADGVIELMPIADAQHYGFKYVNGHPKNYRFDLPTVMAYGGYAEVATGWPLLLADFTLLTALRTAAMSALAARVLARKNSRTMALIGNGAQSEFQALAFHHLLGIREIRLFDIDVNATQKLQANLRESGLQLTVCRDTAHAVKGADIITTVTADKTYATIIHPEMVEAGVHINAVGGDCPGKTELAAGVLERSSVFVEYEPQSRIEGDVQQMPADFPVTELWRVLTGDAVGRSSEQAVTVFDSVGFALEDFSTLRVIHALAQDLAIGQAIDLVPLLVDPKNLFSLLQSNTPDHTDFVAARVSADLVGALA